MSGSTCASCGTELAPHAIACPACGALVHADRLRSLAATAEQAQAAGDVIVARDAWSSALALLPADSRQHSLIRGKVAALTREVDAGVAKPAKAADDRPWWKRGIGAIGTLLLVALTKLKFLLLGLTKLSTFVSMFAFFGVYWGIYGWPLALGLVTSIYIHEMGHVSVLKRLGIAAGAPLFIPGVGALVMLRQHVDDPIIDARIGLAGPVWGLGAGIAALAAFEITGAPIWAAIAQLTAFLNLFNLIPVWQLDGSRGFHALDRMQRWIVVVTVAAALLVTGQKILFLVGGVAVWRAMQKEAGPGDRQAIATYVVLVGALSWIARAVR